MKWSDGTECHHHEQTQKKPQPGEEETEVVSCGSEDGVDGIALGSSQVVALHAVLVFDVTNERLDGGAASHLAFDGRRHSALLACRVDSELMAKGCIVAAVSGIGEKAINIIADDLLHVRNDLCQGMTVIWVTR